MKKSIKNSGILASILLTGALGSLSSNALAANSTSEVLGNGSEIRTTILNTTPTIASLAYLEGKCGEGKCGESNKKVEDKKGTSKTSEAKCGEGKCGEDSKTTKSTKSTKTAKTTKKATSKTSEAKCGEGKCGSK